MTIPQLPSLEQTITKRLSEVLNREINPDYDTDLTNEGMDSIVTIKLIVNLEVEFDIQIDDQDLLVENFSTINKISGLLSEKYAIQL